MDDTSLNLDMSESSAFSPASYRASTPRTYAALRPVSLDMSPISTVQSSIDTIEDGVEVIT